MNRPSDPEDAQSLKSEVEALLDEFLPLAKRLLESQGEFHPYGGYIRSDGSIVHASASDPTTDRPGSTVLVDILRREFRELARRREIRASALVFEVRVRPPGGATGEVDAVQVDLEHADSYCAEVFLPYRLLDAGSVEFGELVAQAGTPVVFSP